MKGKEKEKNLNKVIPSRLKNKVKKEKVKRGWKE